MTQRFGRRRGNVTLREPGYYRRTRRFHGMRVGVTGGAGFIGGHVVDRLIEMNHEPVVFDHLGRKGMNPDVDFMLGDTRDATAVKELAAHVDCIIHLASVLGTQETIGDPVPSAMTNLESGLNCLVAARAHDIVCVNIAVGNWWMLNTYSSSKNLVERFVRQFGREFNMRVANVRCVNAYGPRQTVAPPFGPAKVRKITPSFVCRAITENPIEIYGDGTQVSDMVYVGDVARTLVATAEALAMSNGYTLDHAIEVGPMTSASVNDVAAEVWDTVERFGLADRSRTRYRLPNPKIVDYRIGEACPPVIYAPMRPGEDAAGIIQPGAAAVIERTMRNVGVPEYLARSMLRPLTNVVAADYRTLRDVKIDPASLTPLSVGMAETVSWFAENRGVTWHEPAY